MSCSRLHEINLIPFVSKVYADASRAAALHASIENLPSLVKRVGLRVQELSIQPDDQINKSVWLPIIQLHTPAHDTLISHNQAACATKTLCPASSYHLGSCP